MTRALASLALTLCLALAGAGAAAAQDAEDAEDALGLGQRLDRPLPRAPRGEEANADDGDEADDGEDVDGEDVDGEAERPWPGPQVQLLYGYTKLADGFGGGDAHTGGVSVFLQWPLEELRTGVSAEIGSRDYSLGGDDLLVRGALEVGVQLPRIIDPLVPHLSVLLSVGGLVGQRFESTVAHAFAGGGLELGAELRLLRNFHLAASFGYQRWEMDGAGYDLFLVRLGAGL